MLAILKKEINSFFASPIGYLVIALFLILNGLFLWVFSGDFNILNSGFAEMAPYFILSPWILLFLVPAVTMRSFSDEKKQGNLELLVTKPLSHLQIVLGKYFGALFLILLTLLPTLLYILTLHQLKLDTSTLDVGSILGSYIGLFFLAASYTAIGIFASTLSDNQIVAFISAVFLCFFFYFGFEGISSLSALPIEQLGMDAHYTSISRGVLDSRDLLYFISVSIFFIGMTQFNIHKK